MRCDNCGTQTFVIFIDPNHKKLCWDCYLKNKKKKEIDDEYQKAWVDFFRRANT